MDTTEQRLQALERRVQRSRRANFILLFAIVAVCGFTGAQVKAPPSSKPEQPVDNLPPDAPAALERRGLRTVEAERLILVDRAGRARLRLEVTEQGPAISMFDEQGRQRLELACTNTSSGLRLLDAGQAPVVSLQLPQDASHAQLEIRSPQGSALVKADGFSVYDLDHRGRLQLSLLNGNFPVLGISQRNQSGPPSIELTASDGAPSFKMHDGDGHPLFSVSTAEDGATSVTMRHPDHERSLQLTNGPATVDGPAITFFAPSKEHIGGQLPFLQLGLRHDRQPYVRIVDEQGHPRFTAPTPSSKE